TLGGYVCDHVEALGGVGREVVAAGTVEAMEMLLRGIPLERATTSMTINAPANILRAMYIAVAASRRISSRTIGGTIQNHMLKEFIAPKEWSGPTRPNKEPNQDHPL